MIPKRLLAFTVLEAIVAITLTSLVVALTLLVYTSHQKVSTIFLNNQKKNTEVLLFDYRIKKDINNAEWITYDNNYFVLHNPDSLNIKYQILTDYIIRFSEERKDTHFIKSENLEYSYRIGNLVDEIQFKIITSNSIINYYLYKDYSNATLINTVLYNGD